MKISIKGCNKHLLLFLISSLLIAGNVFAENIKFSFAPKDRTTFIQKLSTIREKQLGPAGTQIDESLSETKIICNKTEEGWDINAKPIKAIMKRNGQEVNNPIIDLLSKVTITYKLDHEGVLKDIVGYEKVRETLNSQFPLDVAQKLAPMLHCETLKQREIAEWNGRIGDYLSKEISIGDVWEYEVPFTLPNGVNLNYKVKTHFKEQIQCGKSKCIVIEQIYDSAAEGMTDLMNNVVKSFSGGDKEQQKIMPKVNQGGSSIKGKVIRLIDPATMNIYKEEIERTMQMEMDVPGQGCIPTKMIEKRSYEYEYEG